MMTAIKTDSQSRVKGLDIGADAFLSKPIDETELVAQVKVMLRIKKAEDDLRKEKETLEKRVEERNVELIKKNDRLKKEIGERKQAENALRESEEKYRTVLEANPDPVIVYDMEGKVIYMNPAFTGVFGWSLDERMGKKMDDFVPEENWPETQMMIDKVTESGKSFSGLETRRYTKEGKIIPISISGSCYLDREGNTAASVINLRDITQQKKLEAELQQTRKMEAMGTLAGGLAHEFNNILGIIIGNTELALDDVPEWNPAKSCLAEIKTASLRAKDVVRQILSFTRKTPAERKSIQISTIVKESLKMIRTTLPTTIEIKQNILCDAQLILGNPTEVNQILLNLCSNSAHAMPEGEGTLGITLEAITLDEKSASTYEDLTSGDYVKLTVQDTGMGIEPNIKDRIFDPYFTTKDIGKGLGMGLAIVYGLVKKHDGVLTVTSKVGKGTIAEVLFPIIKGETGDKIEQKRTLPTGTERILFVDDEPSLVKLVNQMLTRLGYDVVARISSLDALELFKAEPDRFDLVITDMAMPHMAGDRFAHELLKIRPDISIILCTGYSERVDEVRSKELGIKAYVMKPLVMSVIAQTIRKVLDEAKAATQN